MELSGGGRDSLPTQVSRLLPLLLESVRQCVSRKRRERRQKRDFPGKGRKENSYLRSTTLKTKKGGRTQTQEEGRTATGGKEGSKATVSFSDGKKKSEGERIQRNKVLCTRMRDTP